MGHLLRQGLVSTPVATKDAFTAENLEKFFQHLETGTSARGRSYHPDVNLLHSARLRLYSGAARNHTLKRLVHCTSAPAHITTKRAGGCTVDQALRMGPWEKACRTGTKTKRRTALGRTWLRQFWGRFLRCQGDLL